MDNKELEALETIKTIELSHIEQERDENYDGYWEYYEYEKNDGTIEYNFPEEINVIEQALIRKEKLEKAIQLFHDKCDFVYNPKKKMWEFTDIEYFDEEELNTIKEAFEND